jgi:hypothetical protein
MRRVIMLYFDVILYMFIPNKTQPEELPPKKKKPKKKTYRGIQWYLQKTVVYTTVYHRLNFDRSLL